MSINRTLFALTVAASLMFSISGFCHDVEGAGKPLGAVYHSLVDGAYQKLPELLHQGLPSDIKFRLKSGGRPAEVVGKNIYLNGDLITEYIRDPSEANYRRNIKFSRHLNFQLFLEAMIIHELTHIYDFEHRLSWRKEFDLLHSRHSYGDGGANGQNQPNDFVERRPERGNFFEGRSVDPYEFKNPQEAFAVGMEFYALDSTFKCRRPKHFEFYQSLMGTPKIEPSICDNFQVQYYINPILSDDRPYSPRVATPRGHLYAIHYLLAGKGDGVMSRFGHSMLRFVYCDPQRAVPSAECIYDVHEHVVFTPAAGVMDLEISQLDGLTGKYPTAFFATLLGATTELYNRIEERELFSIPLVLSRAELAAVEAAVHESHWTYQNKYYFLTNNCAVEVLNVLKRALPFHQDLQEIYTTTPFSLLERLQSAGIADRRRLSHWRDDKSKQHYFAPVTKTLEQLAAYAAEKMNAPNVKNYLKLSAAERTQIVRSSLVLPDAKRIGRALGALETNILLKRKLAIWKSILKDAKVSQSLSDAHARFHQAHTSWFAAPTVLSKSQYGLPSAEEIQQILNPPQAALAALEENRKSMTKVLNTTMAESPNYRMAEESMDVLRILEGGK